VAIVFFGRREKKRVGGGRVGPGPYSGSKVQEAKYIFRGKTFLFLLYVWNRLFWTKQNLGTLPPCYGPGGSIGNFSGTKILFENVMNAVGKPFINKRNEFTFCVVFPRGVTRGAQFPGGRMTAGCAESPNNVTSTFLNTVHLLPKDPKLDHGGAKLALAPGAIWPRYDPGLSKSQHFVVHRISNQQVTHRGTETTSLLRHKHVTPSFRGKQLFKAIFLATLLKMILREKETNRRARRERTSSGSRKNRARFVTSQNQRRTIA